MAVERISLTNLTPERKLAADCPFNFRSIIEKWRQSLKLSPDQIYQLSTIAVGGALGLAGAVAIKSALDPKAPSIIRSAMNFFERTP